jgi:hypothetical protein
MTLAEIREKYHQKRIVQFGPGRCGTTLIWQVLKEIFPQVEKHHGFVNAYRTVVVYRDFRDSLCSILRIEQVKFKDLTKDRIKLAYKGYINQLKVLKSYQHREDVLFLQYEKFFGDYPFLFSEIEKYFEIELEDSLKKDIEVKTSVMANKKIADRYPKFGVFDTQSFIHGQHIQNPEPGGWKMNIPLNLHDFYEDLLKNDLALWGYK